jgi:5-methyltetrahydropteroyltriglutamate--homocysteine methyltransferase
MADTKPIVRTDQVGSQQRPPGLQQARAAFKDGQIGRAELTAAEDEAILDSIARQLAVGMDVLSDGEFRRDAWMTDVSDAIDGFVDDYPVRATTLPDGTVEIVEFHSKALRGKLRARRRIAQHEAEFLKAHAPALFKLTMPSPNVIGLEYAEGIAAPPYASRAELLDDLVPIMAAEVAALVDEGVPYIQLDQTIGRFATESAREQIRQQGDDPEAALEAEIAADNAVLESARARNVITAKHLCRGSRTLVRGVGGYDWLAERLFSSLKVDRFLLEYDSDAVGGFEPLRFIPKGVVAVLGLVTSKYPALEAQDELLARIEQAAKYCPIDQLALSPQCGFGGSAENNFMSVDEQFRKLENMVQVAERVWG